MDRKINALTGGRQKQGAAGFDYDNDMQLLGVGERLEEAQKWDEGIALFEAYTRLFPRIVVCPKDAVRLLPQPFFIGICLAFVSDLLPLSM
ncbi:MAG: hypothetical protein Q7T20_02525 [Saprospiraceae bacterium]|nr:hypothetical protein [Saprospiraceae bacterium]